ncbi:cell division protein SepF [Pectinatus sottacetonis]|uniref:cell division protein SepF n=1 Tax=Pectinatus sottacetonis TaxID=1002795 RepID=UPI0018C5ECCC|nr:cell division protein SepF [Pectinatus sottacetonis]
MSLFDKFGSKMGLSDSKNTDEQHYNENQNEPDGEYPREDNLQDNVVSFQTAAGSSGSNSNNTFNKNKQMKVIIIEPASFDDAQQIADYIKAHKPVVLNFENTADDIAKRIIDFISGATYALAGDIQKVGQHIFLCAPNNVNVTFSDLTTHPAPPQGDKLPWE